MPDKEPTDAELLAELEKELEKTQNDTLNNNTININDTINLNDTINTNNNGNNNYDAGQLTTFQDSVITTGSDVSILLMVLLLILFIIQAIRKTFNYFTLQSKLGEVENPLDDARGLPAEHLTPLNPVYDHTSYAIYDTVFEQRDIYIQKKKEGSPPSILKEILLKRAVKCIEKFSVIQRDGVGIRKNWNQDLLPKDVWNDFNSAQRHIQSEIESVVRENAIYKFNWGSPHKNDIFSKAKEIYGQKVDLRRKVFHHKLQQQRLKQQQQNGFKNKNKNKNKSKSKAPNAKSFGNGFNSGFFDQNHNNNNNKNKNNSKKLTRKEKKQMNKQQKQMNEQSTQQLSQNNNIDNNNNGYQQTQPHRRKKGKRRFATK